MIARRPEHELLLLCARTRVSSAQETRISELMSQPLNWEYLLALAGGHRVLKLLFWNIRRLCPDKLPAQYDAEGASYLQSSIFRNLMLANKLLQLTKLFEANDIPMLSFKGPCLAMMAYGSLALREFDDLDILVQQRDVERAKDLLCANGYTYIDRNANEGSAASYNPDRGYHFYFVHEQDGSAIELHWQLMKSLFTLQPTFADVQKRLETVSFRGGQVVSLGPEDLLIVLSMHGTKHAWERLAWICDIAELIAARPTMDWRRIMEQASIFHCRRMLLLGLWLAHNLLDTTLPDEMQQQVQAEVVLPRLGAYVTERLFAQDVWNSQPPVISEADYEFHLQIREHLRDRFTYVRQVILPRHWLPNASDRAAVELSSNLSFLYYVTRPLRLARKYGFQPFRRFLGYLLLPR
ncbi:MAG: nucleotidyltransferase family protein [Burkholderiales bacterium]|nr:nucleotidyltransferase family protein [Anaerolineae bacterium]